MFDVEEFVADGYDPEKLEVVIERAMIGLIECKTKEAKWLLNHLELIRDECETS